MRALAEAIARCKVHYVIKSDCKSIIDQIHRYKQSGRRPCDLPAPHLWNFVFDILDVTPDDFAQFRWIPGHLDTKEKREKYKDLLENGVVTKHDIDDNVLAESIQIRVPVRAGKKRTV